MLPHSIVGSCLFQCTLERCPQNTSAGNVQCTESDQLPLVGREFYMKRPDLLDDPAFPVLLLSPCSMLLLWGSKSGRSVVFTQVSSIFSISSPYLIRKLVQREWSADSSAPHPGSLNVARITTSWSRLRSEALLLVWLRAPLRNTSFVIIAANPSNFTDYSLWPVRYWRARQLYVLLFQERSCSWVSVD